MGDADRTGLIQERIYGYLRSISGASGIGGNTSCKPSAAQAVATRVIAVLNSSPVLHPSVRSICVGSAGRIETALPIRSETAPFPCNDARSMAVTAACFAVWCSTAVKSLAPPFSNLNNSPCASWKSAHACAFSAGTVAVSVGAEACERCISSPWAPHPASTPMATVKIDAKTNVFLFN